MEHHGPVVTAERGQGRVRGDAWKGGKQHSACSLPARHNKVMRDADIDTGDGVVMAVQHMLAGCCHCAPHEMPHAQRRIQGTSHQRVPAQSQTRRVASESMNPASSSMGRTHSFKATHVTTSWCMDTLLTTKPLATSVIWLRHDER